MNIIKAASYRSKLRIFLFWSEESETHYEAKPRSTEGHGRAKGTGQITEDKNAPGVKAVVEQLNRRFRDFQAKKHVDMDVSLA